jgi:hypothetical protein
MARSHYTSIRPRDRAWLNDALDRNPNLSPALDRIAGSHKGEREALKQACLSFLFIYENFETLRKFARKDLHWQQKRIDKLNAQADLLIDRSSRKRGGVWSDTRYHQFAALRQAILFAEGSLTSDRALAEMGSYLARQTTPLNVALLKLIEVAGNRYTAVAELAEALLDQAGRTVAIAPSQVREVGRASGLVVIRPPRRK